MDNDRYIRVDPRGDLTLIVGTEDIDHMLVCSRALARASPVFDAMLYGQFKEAKPSDPSASWTVTLPDDDPDAFIVIMRIIHAQLDMVPKGCKRQLFYQVYVLADKYLMTDILLPFARLWYTDYHLHNIWYSPERRIPNERASHIESKEVREHMTIAHFMGDSRSFWSALGYYAFHCRLLDGELYLEPSYFFWHNGRGGIMNLSTHLQGVPGDWLGTIRAMRLGLIGMILRWMAQLLGPVEHGLVCKDGREDCNAQLLARVKEKWEVGYKILPLRKRDDQTECVRDLALYTSDFSTSIIPGSLHGCSIHSNAPDHPGQHWAEYDWNSTKLKAQLCGNWKEIDWHLAQQASKSERARRFEAHDAHA